MRSISVVLPLALPTTYSYSLPPALEERVCIGSRVVVQFGAKRYYTAIVSAVYAEAPRGKEQEKKLKPITDVVDVEPIVLPDQLRFWQWMAQYYMCTLGEVMKAALPSGLKLESETLLVRNPDFDVEVLSPTERELYHALDAERGYTLQALEKELHRGGLMRQVRELMELGAIKVREALTQGFKPRTELYVRLVEEHATEEGVHSLLSLLKRAPAQEALFLRYLDLAQAHAALTLRNAALLKPVSRKALCTQPNDGAALAALRKRGILETYEVETSRLQRPLLGKAASVLPKPLSIDQQRAVEEIEQVFTDRQVCLLHGVTSSGKTEVYIELIRRILEKGEQVLFLVPEIALTTQLTTRLNRVFGAQMGVYHSKFPDAERVELWKRQLSDNPFPLILGVRSSLFLPYKRLGLVIVDEEHETSYKQQDPAPRYQGRDSAIMLARQLGAKVLLGTATPAVETYHNALTGKYGIVSMTQRYGGVQLPQIVVEDIKELQRKKLMQSPFSPRLTEEVRRVLAQGGQAILFQNRRGYSPVLECRTCGWTPRCTKCDVSLTLHQRLGKLVCHYCGAQYNIPTHCPACGGNELRDQGYGTEKIEAEAQRVFPDARIERMDLDTTRSRTAYERIIERFASGESNLLIGTQMVTKGLDFGRVRVVGILNADQMFSVPDFRATERAFQMLSQVAGRAGRRGDRGLVVLQTRQADNPVINQVVHANYLALFHDQMAERKTFHYPPTYRLITVYLKHRDDAVVDHAAQHYAALLRPFFHDDLLGPDRPVVSRVQLQYIRKLMVKIPPTLSSMSVRRSLLSARDVLHEYKVYRGVTVYFDVE